MSKANLLIAACVTAFAVGVVASATASAAWMVGGTTLVESVAVGNGLVLKEGEFTVPGVTSIICKGHEVTITNGRIIAPDKILASSLTFNQCKGSTAPCDLITGEKIASVPIHAVAKLDGILSTYITLLPETKTMLAAIEFTNPECPLAVGGGAPVTGTLSLLIHEGKDERLTHSVLLFTLPNALKVGSSNAEIKGALFDIALQSHKPWSFL